MTDSIDSGYVTVGELNLHYLTAGSGPAVLLLHGWPTSSFLWRNVIPSIAERHRVIALDLPGFGKSDKPLDASYSFRYYDKVLDGALEQLDVERTSLAVHDLGGPIGLFWAARRLERVERLALLNTLVYPEASWAVVLFVIACRLPALRSFMASRTGLRLAMRLGVHDPKRLSGDVYHQVSAPFATRDARRALLKTGINLSPKGFVAIARRLPSFAGPVRILYGERDRFLPDVAKTMKRVKEDLPQAEVTSLPDCGHFLQEERPVEVGGLLAEFFAAHG